MQSLPGPVTCLSSQAAISVQKLLETASECSTRSDYTLCCAAQSSADGAAYLLLQSSTFDDEVLHPIVGLRLGDPKGFPDRHDRRSGRPFAILVRVHHVFLALAIKQMDLLSGNLNRRQGSQLLAPGKHGEKNPKAREQTNCPGKPPPQN